MPKSLLRSVIVENPLLPGCYPDPSITRGHDGAYYLVTSTFEYFPGLPIFRSEDLAHWDQIGHVIDRDGMLDFQGLPSSKGLYAPTIRFHDGTYYLVCTLVDEAAPDRDSGGPRATAVGRGNFIVTATNPAGPWSDPIWLGTNGIDPSLFFDESGTCWLHGTRLAAERRWHDQTEVWLQKLDLATMELVGPEYVIWTGALENAVWAEGPHIYARDGYYYLLAAEAGTEAMHAIVVARAENVTGPYVGFRGNPVLTHRHLGQNTPVIGIGHADLIEGPDGNWWAVALGMRPYRGSESSIEQGNHGHYNLGRETFLIPVQWQGGPPHGDPEPEPWPVLAPGLGRVPDEVEVPDAQDRPFTSPQRVRSGVVTPDDFRWNSLRGSWREFATPMGDGWLLTPLPISLDEPRTPAFLGVRQQHMRAAVTARIDASSIAPGVEAGLVARQSEDDHVRLGVTRDGEDVTVTLLHRLQGAFIEVGTLNFAQKPEPLVLRLVADGQDYRWYAGFGEAKACVGFIDGSALDSRSAGGFLGVWLGVYAVAGSEDAGEIRVLDFRYDC